MNTENILDDLDNNVESLMEMAVQKHQSGQLDEAQFLYKHILKLQDQSDNQYHTILPLGMAAAIASGNLGSIFEQQGFLKVAQEYYQKALSLNPDYAEAYYNLGNVFKKQGLKDAAAKSYQQALKIQPKISQAHNNLGTVLHQQGFLEAAIKSYQQALEIEPNYAQAYHNLGNIFLQQSLLEAAEQSYQQAVNCQPNYTQAHHSLGNVLKLQGKLDAALNSYQQAVNLNPNYTEAHQNLGNTLYEQGNLEAAIASYHQVLRLQPDFAPAKFAIAIGQLPIVYANSEEIDIKRDDYRQHLISLAQSYKALPERELAADAIGTLQPFYLAYQGRNDRDLQQIYGEMITGLMSSRYPQWSKIIPLPKLEANEKIRIGFVSRFFYNHSNWKIPIQGWVENLDRSKFELFGYHTGAKQDGETIKAAKAFDKFHQELLSLEQWCELIQKDNLHVLLFPEFGMDPMTLKLGCLRLASIQMTSWGHPSTSGLPTIDYYLSSDLMEPENAQDHYTEKLVKLPNLSIYYQHLETQQGITKKQIGINNDEIMFWCCQSLFKYLPENDDVFPQIASYLDSCKFVFIKYSQGEYITDIFEQRLDRAFGKLGLNYQDYCIFLPPMDGTRFAGITASSDVFLDSIGWSGCNSTLEALAHNIPVLTLPGDLMRGRHTMAMLKMMGIEETIAATKEDYVKIAVRLGQDTAYRQHISKLVASNKHKLYGDLKPVRALEEFFFKAVNKPRRFAQQEVADILQLAVQSQRENNLAEAQQLYHQVVEKHPDHPEALYNLGMLAQRLGQPQTALKWLNAAAQVQPDVKTWFSLGNLHFAQNQFAPAAKAYRQALALRPDALPIYNNLGYALQQQGLFDEAINYYQKALELKPDFIEVQANLGNALHAQGKLSSQQQLIHAQLNNKLGLQSKKALDLNAAVAYYRVSIALQPDFVEAHYNLGVALQELQEFDEALACYQRVLELNPNYTQVYFNLAQYQQQNDLEKAISTYRQGLKLINPYYAKALSERGSGITQELPVTPPIPQTEVQIGNQQFPAIPVQEEQKRPFWTVVIPVYATPHRRQYLLQCLASVLMQWPGHSEMEILLIDDASVPPLYDLVNAIGGGIIRYYRNPQNMGAYRNFNIGVALSRGQWIHLLHDDDYVLPGFYHRLKQSLEGCPESVGAAFTGYENINETGKVVFTQQVYGKYQGIAPDFLQRIGVVNPLNMPAVVISRKVHEHLGGYLPELNYTGDWEFYKRIAAFYDWWCEPEILARYRQHSDNITTESILSGSKGTCLRRAIEVSQDYIPQEITAESRSHHFNYCLKEAAIPLHFGKVDGALRMVREALIIDRSTESVAKLFAWLKQDEAALLRDEIASKFI